ncbi:phage minor head protein [Propionivibrio dicarboxylicus]|uniref:Phage Mu protein F like protein n=1 Tax=Propionivibrio dicarboxylicus TaxID=83767 RepID=A0A1G8LCX0_9RHOO|nr:phage minor head protein [Propionivibrio dicarboxylicus]SDI53463.1 Phage Mu protein F like protein [Propionivibrio dicarboxylicus]
MKFGFNTPFEAQLEFFRQKLNLPSERWDDIVKAANDRAFIVAGAMQADLIQDLRFAIDRSMRDGLGIEAFRTDFRQIVQQHGWTGWTGEGSKAGEAWRTKVIYQTNMATSYAAGRYRQLTDPDFLAEFPYWRYVHNDSVMHPRPMHAHWGQIRLTLRYDHPFWATHYPPNGWGCHCRVVPVREPGEGDATEPPAGWDERDGKGLIPGIDRGFDYAPGANVSQTLQALIDAKLIRLDAPIGAAMYEAMKDVITLEQRAAEFAAWIDSVVAAGVTRNEWEIVGAVRASEIDALENAGLPRPTTAEIAVEDSLVVGKKAARHEQAGDALSIAEWKRLPELLDGSRRTYLDKTNGKLLYVLPSADDDRSIRLVVEIDFVMSKEKVTLNMVRSAFKINTQALEDRTRYEVVR